VTAPDKPDPRTLVSAQLLLDLVNNTLDPGYAAVARKRQQRDPAGRPTWYERPAVAVGCLLIGFLLVVAYVHTHRGAPEAAKVHGDLVARVRNAEEQNTRLENEDTDLQRQLAAAQRAALADAGPVGSALAGAELAAGEVAVTGPGLTVTLRDPPTPTSGPSGGRGGSTPITATNILTDRDVRSVVNELWADGAEAISVNDIRLTPTSAIRFAGQAVLVDFQPITSPYRISAIGSPDTLATNFAESSVASRYQTLAGVEHIGFTFAESDHLSLPASTPVTPRYATVAKGSR
jgi:uncharacterized protein YlxW (UPF0749 family)